jgi:hypothetical protein
METTILLSKVFGLYLVIIGIIIMIRKTYTISVVSTFVEERFSRLTLACIELLAGLFLVTIHFDYSNLAGGIISTIGVVAIIESIMYLSMSDSTLNRFIRTLNTPSMYILGGLASVAVGLYLLQYAYQIV